MSATHKFELEHQVSRATQAHGMCTQHVRSPNTHLAQQQWPQQGVALCQQQPPNAENQLLSGLAGLQMVCRLHVQCIFCWGDFKQQPWADSDDQFANTKAWQDLAPANAMCQAFVCPPINVNVTRSECRRTVADKATCANICESKTQTPKHYLVQICLCKLVYPWESVSEIQSIKEICLSDNMRR